MLIGASSCRTGIAHLIKMQIQRDGWWMAQLMVRCKSAKPSKHAQHACPRNDCEALSGQNRSKRVQQQKRSTWRWNKCYHSCEGGGSFSLKSA